VLGVFIACGTPFDALLYYAVPGWSSTGSPGRAIVLFVLACCCLAGLAIRDIEEKDKSKLGQAFGVFILITAGIAMFATLVFRGVLSVNAGQGIEQLVDVARAQNMPMFIIATLLAIAGVALWATKKPAQRIGLLIAAPLIPFVLSQGVLRTGEPIAHATESTSFDRVAYVNPAWNMFVTPQAIMPPNMATLLRIHDVSGYDSLLDKDTKALLDSANGQDSSPPENGNMLLYKGKSDPSSLGALGVSEIWLPSGSAPVPGQGRVSNTGGPAKITAEDFRSISINATGPGLLSLKDRNMEGWTATVDGKPVQIHPGPFREIDLPAGQHKVEFKYWPPGLTPGLVLFLLGMLPVVIMLTQRRATNRGL
jgi:hypothetical protein